MRSLYTGSSLLSVTIGAHFRRLWGYPAGRERDWPRHPVAMSEFGLNWDIEHVRARTTAADIRGTSCKGNTYAAEKADAEDRGDGKPENQSDPLAHQVKQVCGTPHGGLVYINMQRNTLAPTAIEVCVKGGSRAPQFVLTTLPSNETSAEEFSDMCSLNVPWGELIGDRVLFVIPMSLFRNVKEPKRVLKFWDTVMECFADFLPNSSQTATTRSVSFIVDCHDATELVYESHLIDITEETASKLVEIASLVTVNVMELWSVLVRIGYIYSRQVWPFHMLDSATAQLAASYVYELLTNVLKVEGMIFDPLITAMLKAKRRAGVKYIMAKPFYSSAPTDDEILFAMLLHLRRAFGWPMFRKVFLFCAKGIFSVYTTEQKWHDIIIDTFSSAANRNLVSYFQSFGMIRTSQSNDNSVVDNYFGSKPPMARQRWAPDYEESFSLMIPVDGRAYERRSRDSVWAQAHAELTEEDRQNYQRRTARRSLPQQLADLQANKGARLMTASLSRARAQIKEQKGSISEKAGSNSGAEIQFGIDTATKYSDFELAVNTIDGLSTHLILIVVVVLHENAYKRLVAN